MESQIANGAVAECDGAAEIPWRSFLLDSNWAAACVGPNAGHPRCWSSSTTPRLRGSSGPSDGQVGSQSRGQRRDRVQQLLQICRQALGLIRDAAISRSSQEVSVTREDCRNFHTSACWRRPLPKTRIFIARENQTPPTPETPSATSERQPRACIASNRKPDCWTSRSCRTRLPEIAARKNQERS